jgi:hypothetical protein
MQLKNECKIWGGVFEFYTFFVRSCPCNTVESKAPQPLKGGLPEESEGELQHALCAILRRCGREGVTPIINILLDFTLSIIHFILV